MRNRKNVHAQFEKLSYAAHILHGVQLENLLRATERTIRSVFEDVCDDYGFKAVFSLEIMPVDAGKPHVHEGRLFVNPRHVQRDEDYIALYNCFFSYLKKRT